jgi:thiamine biosynthesis lipoprotein
MTAGTAQASWQALGTSVELALTDSDALAPARSIVEQQLDEIDRACSRFRTDSELTRVNTCAGRTVHIDPLLLEAIEIALRAAELTDGDVDPTIGATLELAGYDRDWRLLEQPSNDRSDRSEAAGQHTSTCLPFTQRHLMPAIHSEASIRPAQRVLATRRSGWQAVELDRDRATLRMPTGIKLDLGATAKAWAADRASHAVNEAIGCGVLVSLGGDISTAGPSPATGWRIHVTDDHRSGPDAPGQTISIAAGGLATSSTTVRRWRQRERTMHHIIDPATGEPTAGMWRTVSVAAIDCVDANIAATAAIVRGRSATDWLAGLGLPTRLVSYHGDVLTIGSWPQEGKPS